MCRNIRVLHNFEPPATEEEIHAAALQFVRKVSGSVKPAKANQQVFDQAIDQIAEITTRLLAELVAHSPPRNREHEAEKAKARWQAREAKSGTQRA